MRAAVPGLRSPQPLGERLPAVYAADDLAQRLTAAYDDVLSAVFATLDCLWAYFDPALAPPDFLEWLATWVYADLVRPEAGREPSDGQLARRRTVVAGAVPGHRARGTAAAMVTQFERGLGLRVEVIDSGATTWSRSPGAALPGSAEPTVTVRVAAADAESVPRSVLLAMVEANRPANVRCVIEVVPRIGDAHP